MDFKERQQKIDYSRSIDRELSPLPHNDILTLWQSRSDAEGQYLIYIDADDNRNKVSYAECYEHVLNCAWFLQNPGLSQADGVATISHNHWHTIVQYYAAWLWGLVVVLVNT